MVGCTSIWVMAEKKHIPLLKTVIGSYIEDPVLAQLPMTFKGNFKMKIPIWYASLPVRDIERRDCYARSIMAGAEYATSVSARLSSFLVPEKFYVSFPYTTFSPWRLQVHRKEVRNENYNFFLTQNGLSIKDGQMLGFTFFQEDLKRYKKDFATMDVGEWHSIGEGADWHNPKFFRRLPKEQQNTGRHVTLDMAFRSATLEDATVLDAGVTYDISNWQGYTEYIKHSRHFRMPRKVAYFRHRKLKNLESRLIECEVYDDYDYANGETGAEQGSNI